MQADTRTSPRRGSDALKEAIERGQRGDYAGALRFCEEALEWATEHEDEALWDRAYCNRSVALLELGRLDESLSQLRRIVLRDPEGETGFLAAYAVACAYDQRGSYERSLFYARIARDRALRLERPAWLSWTHNHVGNVLLAQSYFDEACEEYELALKLMPLEPSVERALILDNLGYCRFVQGEYREGFRLLFESLRTLVRHDVPRFRAVATLTLAFGYLEIGKLRRARHHADAALRAAQELGDDGTVKKTYYLLGEIYHQLGFNDRAREFFTRLQRDYYPEAPHVPELLMAIDVRSMVNLKA
jgi:tetratricopeptide (TPR) repeat protein